MSFQPGTQLLDRITTTSTMDDVSQNRKATKEVLIQAILGSENHMEAKPALYTYGSVRMPLIVHLVLYTFLFLFRGAPASTAPNTLPLDDERLFGLRNTKCQKRKRL